MSRSAKSRKSLTLLAGTILGTALSPAPILAQEDATREEQIVVTAAKIRGQIDTDQPPIVELNAEDIAAMGVNSISDLIGQMGSQADSDKGREGGEPIYMINGIPVANRREFHSYPTEAIVKMEILPESVAVKFGYSPNQRLMNFILKPNFISTTAEGEYHQSELGGRSQNEQEVSFLTIGDKGRLNVQFVVKDESPLTESERDLPLTALNISSVKSDADPRLVRSLLKDTSNLEGSANYVLPLMSMGGSLSVNFTAGRDDKSSMRGLNRITLRDTTGNEAMRFIGTQPITYFSRTENYASAISFNAGVGKFRLTVLADGKISEERVRLDGRLDASGLATLAAAGSFPLDGVIDLAAPGIRRLGAEMKYSKTNVLSSKSTLSGNILALPSGDVSLTLDAGLDYNKVSSKDGDYSDSYTISRTATSGGVSLNVPIVASDVGILGALGNIGISGQGAVEDISDFRTLYRWNGDISWQPSGNISLGAAYSKEERAPGLDQLAYPNIVSENIPTYDYARDEDVLISVISGGNKSLKAETRKDWTFWAYYEVPFLKGLSLNTYYNSNKSRDITAGYPALTADVESAFPDRVTRDSDGRLIALDQSLISFEKRETKSLNFDIHWMGSFGKAKPAPPPPPSGNGAAPGSPVMMIGPGGMRGGDGKGRIFANISFKRKLSDKLWFAPGLAPIDLMQNGAILPDGGSRNSGNMELSVFRNGLGMRLNGDYVGPSKLLLGEGAAKGNLYFSHYTNVDARFFAELDRVLGSKSPILKGMRLALEIDNLLNAKQVVRDSSGATPDEYLPLRIHPMGRVWGISLRKRF